MKRIVLVIAVALMLCISANMAEAYVWGTDYPFTGDFSTIYDRYSWDGWNHLNLTMNSTRATASATQISPDGIPGVYYWADYYTTYYDLYISYDGYNWYHYGSYYL
ncbi:MAG: hypothetical protein HZB62_06565 [Nitrospirae bacterium]|nr:hypothetical protein [Nitrospirota bacterium]